MRPGGLNCAASALQLRRQYGRAASAARNAARDPAYASAADRMKAGCCRLKVSRRSGNNPQIAELNGKGAAAGPAPTRALRHQQAS
jgi:hypothetical protein